MMQGRKKRNRDDTKDRKRVPFSARLPIESWEILNTLGRHLGFSKVEIINIALRRLNEEIAPDIEAIRKLREGFLNTKSED